MPLETVSALAVGLPIVASLLFLMFVLAGCVCFKDKHNHLQISPIRFTLSGTILRDREVNSARNQENGNLSATDHAKDPLENAKIKVPTLLRKLPEIPVNSVLVPNGVDGETTAVDLQNIDSGSELYAIVDTSNRKEHEFNNVDSVAACVDVPDNSLPAPVDSVPDLLKTSNLVTSGESDGDNLYSQVHHRYDKVKNENLYARVKGQTSEERDTDTENYDDSSTYTKMAIKRMWNHNGNAFEPPPPVPEKNFDSQLNDDDDLGQPSTSSSHLTAANAVTGRVSATDIPYVTSPVESPLRQPIVQQRPISQSPLVPDLVYNTSQDSGDGQDIRYTSISVREPLANLRSNLERNLQQERQESYYMVVSDDDLEQTYDEIRDQSDNGNTAYATVEVHETTRELPPVPPPVESLRSIASVNSRKSILSSSPSSNPGLSDSDSRHPSPYSSSAAVSSSPLSDTSDLYSTVNKPKSYNRRTIHVVDQQSIEEMYAKVLKHKHMSLIGDTSSTTIVGESIKSKVPLPELPTFSKDLTKLQVKSIMSSNEQVNDETLEIEPVKTKGDPGYESVKDLVDTPFEDPVYERINDGENNVDIVADEFMSDSFDIPPGYETVVEARNLDRNSNPIEDELQLDPGYETLNHNVLCTDIDPDYEEIGRRQMSDIGSEIEPGYEQIRSKVEVQQEPGYESIKNSGNATSSNAQLSDDYETINCGNKDENFCYERLGSPYDDGEDEFSDPSYEQVNFKLDNSESSNYRARESWDLSPRCSDMLSDEASGSMTSLQEDISKGSNDVEQFSPKHQIAQKFSDDKYTERITEPQYAVVRKKKKNDTTECNNREINNEKRTELELNNKEINKS